MIRIKRSKLSKIIFELKKYGLTHYTVGYCCGNQYFMWKIWLLLNLIFRDSYVWTCPICHYRHRVKLVYHIVSEDNREENKLLKEW